MSSGQARPSSTSHTPTQKHFDEGDSDITEAPYQNNITDSYNSGHEELFPNECYYGVGSWRPESLQFLASLWGFVAFCSVSSLCKFCIIQYTQTLISSIEDHFRINSSKSAFLMSSIEFGSVCFVLVGSHFGKFTHIPRLLSISSVVLGIAVMCVAVVQAGTPRSLPDGDFDSETTLKYKGRLCWSENALRHLGIDINSTHDVNAIRQEFRKYEFDDEYVDGDIPWTYYWMLSVLFVSGAAMSYMLPLKSYYVETNVEKKRQSGVYLGVLTAAMLLGSPTALFIGGVMNQLPVDLGDTKMKTSDPRWISAWWLGYVIIGLLNIVTSVPVFCLPRYIIHRNEIRNDLFEPVQTGSHEGIDLQTQPVRNYRSGFRRMFNTSSYNYDSIDKHQGMLTYNDTCKDQSILPNNEKFKDWAQSLKRICSKPLIIILAVEGFVTFTGIFGTMSFEVKYFKHEFDKSASYVSYSIGLAQLLTSATGTLLGGYIITRYATSRAAMFKFTLVTQLVSVLLTIIFFFLGCDDHEIRGYNDFSKVANSECSCSNTKILFVCGTDDHNYLSPCHAGCEDIDGLNYRNCTIVGGEGRAEPGLCGNGCSAFYAVQFVYVIVVFISSCSFAPRTLMVLRSVAPEDQSLVTGLISGLIIRSAAISGPVLFGKLIDSACLLWPEGRGSCKLFDKKDLRHKFIGTGVLTRGAGIVFLFLATVLAHREQKQETHEEADILVRGGRNESDTER